ncbi:MAG: adenylate/guanylate cyclase domain-containing protein [Acidimicrobiales bacterium]
MSDLDAFLVESGKSPAEIQRAEAEGALELLVLECVLQPEPPRYDLDETARLGGISTERMHQLWRAMGFPDPPPGELVSGSADLRLLDWARDRVQEPEAFDRTVQLLRISASSLARMAESVADDLADQLESLRAVGLSSREAAAAALEQANAAQIEGVVFHLFRIQLLAAVRRRFAGDRPAGLQQQLAVGFVDLVGFTSLSQELEPDELAAMVSDFETRAYSTVAENGGRVVKTIGDEVMFSSSSPQAAVEIALRLAGDERRGPQTPDVRAGIAYGAVVSRFGDEFGPVVNLASRLVNIALPGTVLVSEEVHGAVVAVDGLHWRPLRARRLKGLGRVPAWVVRRAEPR